MAVTQRVVESLWYMSVMLQDVYCFGSVHMILLQACWQMMCQNVPSQVYQTRCRNMPGQVHTYVRNLDK